MALHFRAVSSFNAGLFAMVALRASQFSQSNPQHAISCFILGADLFVFDFSPDTNIEKVQSYTLYDSFCCCLSGGYYAVSFRLNPSEGFSVRFRRKKSGTLSGFRIPFPMRPAIRPFRPNRERSHICAYRVFSVRRVLGPGICGGRTRQANPRTPCGWRRSLPNDRRSRC